jgi:hypothetical protein
MLHDQKCSFDTQQQIVPAENIVFSVHDNIYKNIWLK